MLLNRVTVTGADDSVEPADLIALAAEYPFLEFGILLSASQVGTQRFPSVDWQGRLARAVAAAPDDARIRFSGHICGRWVREIYKGFIDHRLLTGPMWMFFSRIQLNTHGVSHPVPSLEPLYFLMARLQSLRQVILQYDGANNGTFQALTARFPGIAALVDGSHGGGKSPERWTRPFGGYCGYAGGLSPENLEDELKRIARQHGDDPAWVDAETKLFTAGVFDLGRVRAFAEAAKPWIMEGVSNENRVGSDQ